MTTSLLGPNSFGADTKRLEVVGTELSSDDSDESMGVAGWDSVRRGNPGTLARDDHAGPFEPGHLRLPGRNICEST